MGKRGNWHEKISVHFSTMKKINRSFRLCTCTLLMVESCERRNHTWWHHGHGYPYSTWRRLYSARLQTTSTDASNYSPHVDLGFHAAVSQYHQKSRPVPFHASMWEVSNRIEWSLREYFRRIYFKDETMNYWFSKKYRKSWEQSVLRVG